MLNIIKEISQLWPEYYKKETEDKEERAYKLIEAELPEYLKDLNVGKDHLVVASSGGQGRITAGPWFATFDERITTKAEEGYYLVFLFSVDMKRIVLELGLATRQFTRFHGESANTNHLIRNAAMTLQLASQNICSAFPNQGFIGKIKKGPSNLSTELPASKHKLQKTYEQASIFHISYDINNLESSTILDDYRLFLDLYQKIASDPSIPTTRSLFDSSLEAIPVSSRPKIPPVKPFSSREPKKLSTKSSKGSYSGKRKSPDAKKIGDFGENIVLVYEREKLKNIGRSDLAGKIVHEEAENNRPGWDISSFDEDGKNIQIEVKSSTSDAINNLTITYNEWEAAKQYKDSYHIYLVSGVTKNGASQIEVIKDPVSYYDNKVFSLKVGSYDLKLN